MNSIAPAVVVLLMSTGAGAQEDGALLLPERRGVASATLEDAQRLFYSGRYDEASVLASHLCAASDEEIEACELRTSSLHFQIRTALRDARDGDAAWKMCAACPGLMSAFLAETAQARARARASLQRRPSDATALFLLGKINLNYVWLQLGTLGRRTGLAEYREARASLDRALDQNPGHVRARVARAWIDYIIGTKMPRGTRWLLGGGNKRRGLQAVREAAGGEGDFFDQAEASFALWDMQVRERDLVGAVATARELARDFPDNRELARFLDIHGEAR